MRKCEDHIKVSKLILNFRDFFFHVEKEREELVFSVWWEGEETELCNDYHQMNWELLVEEPLKVRYPGISLPSLTHMYEEKILWSTQLNSTHGIFVFPKNKDKPLVDVFGEVVSLDKKFLFKDFTAIVRMSSLYENKPVLSYCQPLDFVVMGELDGEQCHYVKYYDVEFWLMPLPSKS
jgi:hypothetical protein